MNETAHALGAARTLWELVERRAALTPDRPVLLQGDRVLTFGGLRDIWRTENISFGIGSDVTFYSKPAVLDQIYGNHPVGWKLFLRVRPGKMDMSSMH